MHGSAQEKGCLIAYFLFIINLITNNTFKLLISYNLEIYMEF